MGIDITKLPQLKGQKYSERITLVVTPETKQRLEGLRHNKKVDVPELLRRMIDDLLEKVDTVSA